ncbi:MAG: TssQ family T6SS-associated lipoprotein [Pseudomonadota bacterium]
MLHRILIIAIAALLATGCATGPFGHGGGKAEQELAAAIHQYEDGDYKSAARRFQEALDEGLRARADKVTAHKYLAFIHCASNREKACREEFRLALELDPGFELSQAEQGHPIWGPVYRNVRASLGAGKARGR